MKIQSIFAGIVMLAYGNGHFLGAAPTCLPGAPLVVFTNNLCPGFNLIANPLLAFNPYGSICQEITNVLSFMPDGSSFMKYAPTYTNCLGAYTSADVYFTGVTWVDLWLSLSTTQLDLYEGAFVEVPHGWTILITGCMVDPASAPPPPLAPGWSIRSCPMGMPFSACIPGPADGDTILFWDCALQRWKDPLTYFVGMGWFDSSLTMVTPSPRDGEAFFYYHDCR